MQKDYGEEKQFALPASRNSPTAVHVGAFLVGFVWFGLD